jgi:hypothetical protein
MLQQSFNLEVVNSILNHPDVLPGITDDAAIDVTELMLSGRGIALVSDDGNACYLLVRAGERVWEIHTNIKPEGRGVTGVKTSGEAIEWAFANTDAETLVTMAGNDSVRRYAEHFGFQYIGNASPNRTFPAPCMMLRLSLLDWIDRSVAGNRLASHGVEFHETIESHRHDLGIDGHGDDHLHDIYAGFVVAMLRHFNMVGAIKAERIYNDWARQAGYGQISVLQVSRDEVLVDIGDMVIVVTADRFYRITQGV